MSFNTTTSTTSSSQTSSTHSETKGNTSPPKNPTTEKVLQAADQSFRIGARGHSPGPGRKPTVQTFSMPAERYPQPSPQNSFTSTTTSVPQQLSQITLKPETPSCRAQDTSTPLAIDVGQLWKKLQDETSKWIEWQAAEDPNAFLQGKERPLSRFEYPCPRATAVCVQGVYLNAHHVGAGVTQRKFVASQAPLKTSASSDYLPFWRAVFDSEFTILDLTNESDTKGETELEKVTEYGPNFDVIMPCGLLSITLKHFKMNRRCPAQHYTYEITENDSKNTKTVHRYRYHLWPDGDKIPVENLDKLVQEIVTSQDKFWVHCRAGMGRTGTLIAAVILNEKINNGQIIPNNLGESLFNIIFELRKQRGSGFVQRPAQLETLVDYAQYLFTQKK